MPKQCAAKGCDSPVFSGGVCKYHQWQNPKKKKKNKYNAVKCRYGGMIYDSGMEARYAEQLDWLVQSGEVTEVKPQHRLDLVVNGIRVAMYKVDFRVTYKDGRIEYHEVKGAETAMWRLKWKLSKALFPDHKFVLIKKV